MKKKTRKIAKQIGAGVAIIGGVVAAGYAATKLLREDVVDGTAASDNETHPMLEPPQQQETPEQMNMRDALPAQDFERV